MFLRNSVRLRRLVDGKTMAAKMRKKRKIGEPRTDGGGLRTAIYNRLADCVASVNLKS